ncbi:MULTISPECIES: ComF family protein [Cupriavidus]|uniref:ComF family protein n=1 Tax=Cupriavidus TaxID=106589 RepID=UPI000A4072F0|nr:MULTISPECIES: ComF family protein [Cupriavidus]
MEDDKAPRAPVDARAPAAAREDEAQVYARCAGRAGGRAAGRALALGRAAWRACLDALLPCACALCGQVQREVVCAGCAQDLLPVVPRCPVCGLPAGRSAGGASLPCAGCRQAAPSFDAALTLGDYAPPQDSLVLALKFGGVLPLAGWLAAQLAGRMVRSGFPAPALLAPVPLAPRRLATRGFNQAWEIARPLARQLGVRADPVLLRRRRETSAQSALDLAARGRNVQDAFALSVPARLDGLHVGLVDDVMTSGATLAAAARTLKAHGAARVTVLVALRTP